MSNKVYCAVSLDGYIASNGGGVEWLEAYPSTPELEKNYKDFIDSIDAIVMGHNTFKTVIGFGEEMWHYTKPVFVLSRTSPEIPQKLQIQVKHIQGFAKEITHTLNQQGYTNLYIDGGITISHFLNEDCIDELILTTIPILLGSGIPLFGTLNRPLNFTAKKSFLLSGLVQSHYIKS